MRNGGWDRTSKRTRAFPNSRPVGTSVYHSAVTGGPWTAAGTKRRKKPAHGSARDRLGITRPGEARHATTAGHPLPAVIFRYACPAPSRAEGSGGDRDNDPTLNTVSGREWWRSGRSVVGAMPASVPPTPGSVRAGCSPRPRPAPRDRPPRSPGAAGGIRGRFPLGSLHLHARYGRLSMRASRGQRFSFQYGIRRCSTSAIW